MDIRAVIFDMDGVLIDSEPFWREAEQKVFKTVGVHLSDDDCRSTAGLRIDEVVQLWFERHPWKGPGIAEIRDQVVSEVIRLIHEKGEPLPGIPAFIQEISNTNLPIGLATSSPRNLMNAVIESLELGAFFQVMTSAEGMRYGKPHPQVFMDTADQLGMQHTHCVVIEDTVNGVIAAKAARMQVIAVPEAANLEDKRFHIADRVLKSTAELSGFLSDLKRK